MHFPRVKSECICTLKSELQWQNTISFSPEFVCGQQTITGIVKLSVNNSIVSTNKSFHFTEKVRSQSLNWRELKTQGSQTEQKMWGREGNKVHLHNENAIWNKRRTHVNE